MLEGLRTGSQGSNQFLECLSKTGEKGSQSVDGSSKCRESSRIERDGSVKRGGADSSSGLGESDNNIGEVDTDGNYTANL